MGKKTKEKIGLLGYGVVGIFLGIPVAAIIAFIANLIMEKYEKSYAIQSGQAQDKAQNGKAAIDKDTDIN